MSEITAQDLLGELLLGVDGDLRGGVSEKVLVGVVKQWGLDLGECESCRFVGGSHDMGCLDGICQDCGDNPCSCARTFERLAGK